MRTIVFLSLLLAISYFLLFPQSVSAHAFGALYNLPVPFWLYLYGAGAALVVSFLIIGFFLNQAKHSPSYTLYKISSWPLKLTPYLKAFSVLTFFLTILTGLFGTQSLLDNFNMTWFWIIFLLGLTYLTALVGDIYFSLNPWKILVDLFEKLAGYKFKGMLTYPPALAYYPALIFYFFLIWTELFGLTTPFKLSHLIINYTTIVFIGSFLFGKQAWFEYGELFSVFFRLIGQISPIEKKSDKLYFRPPFVGLTTQSASHFSLLLFILFMLSSTAFDGFHSTYPWIKFSLNLSQILEPHFKDSYLFIQRVGLLLSPFAFLLVYLTLISLMKLITRVKLSIGELLLRFAYSLIPIALVYNIAHYYTLLLAQGQEIIRIISDPFGFGWNLFGTTNFISNPAPLGAGFVWHSQVAFILVGHISATYLAHLTSLKTFSTRKQAILSQVPMLALMVVYTTTGLWILSQPIKGI